MGVPLNHLQGSRKQPRDGCAESVPQLGNRLGNRLCRGLGLVGLGGRVSGFGGWFGL